MPHLLVLDDDATVCEVLVEIARDHGFSVAQAATMKDAMIQIQRQAPDLVLTDVHLAGDSGMDIFSRMPNSDAEVVVITGYGSMDNAVEALRLGATDYLVKPVCLDRLSEILTRIAADRGVTTDNEPFREPGRFGKLVGQSEPMERLFTQLARVAVTDVTTLLIGESGTGKELAAHAIHQLSTRSNKPFIAVNCGAISPHLIESELFGHERGSFTGADRQHKGYFERADSGTLFLDEVTEMPLDLQVKLLRVLETGRFMRVGTHREIACDIRIVAATNRNPERAIHEGKLREDLYYRLSVFPIELPPLRDRGTDIPFLADRFLETLNEKYGEEKQFSEQARQAIQEYAWPGNVRELKNYVRRAYILAEDGILSADALQPQIAPDGGSQTARVTVPLGVTLAEADRRLIMATLERCGGVKKQTAAVLGISSKTLYNRLEEYTRAGHVIAGDGEKPQSPEH